MIDQEGRKVTNRQRICNMLNDHFSTIGKNMASKFNSSPIDPLSYIRHDITASLFMTPTSKEEIIKIIEKLHLKKLLQKSLKLVKPEKVLK